MSKRKKIIISLSISLVVLLSINFITNSQNSSKFIKVPVFNSNLLQGSSLNKKDISYINVEKATIKNGMLDDILDFVKDNYVLKKDVFKGEIALKSLVETSSVPINQEYEYVSLPISSDSVVTCKNMSFGDMVNVYYTAKAKDVNSIIKNKEKIYSNNLEGMVTCKLLENVKLVDKCDSTGGSAKENVITNILIMVTKKDAMIISNLKSLGTFDVVTSSGGGQGG